MMNYSNNLTIMFMGRIPQGPKQNYVKTVLLAMMNDLHLNHANTKNTHTDNDLFKHG